jgi:L-glyceraldehyde 3-phosphate reductase
VRISTRTLEPALILSLAQDKGGPPYGWTEENFGRVIATDFKIHRDELVISTMAGWEMRPGPYGGIGGSRKYRIARCDQSLKRMGLD